MKRTLILMLSGALLALPGACADDTDGEKTSESTVLGERGPHGKRGMHGPHGKRGMRDPGARAQMMQKRLGLTDEQTEKVKAVFEADTTREEKQKTLEAILTPEQLTQYKEMKSRRGKRGKRGKRGMRGMRAPGKHAEWLQQELGLTDEVTARVKAVFEADTTREEKQKALEGILGPEDFAQYEELKAHRGRWKKGKRGFKGPEKRAAWMQKELGLTDEQKTKLEAAFENSKNRDEMLEALESILTPEQLAEHEQMMAEHRGRFGKHGKRGMHGRGGKRGGPPQE